MFRIFEPVSCVEMNIIRRIRETKQSYSLKVTYFAILLILIQFTRIVNRISGAWDGLSAHITGHLIGPRPNWRNRIKNDACANDVTYMDPSKQQQQQLLTENKVTETLS